MHLGRKLFPTWSRHTVCLSVACATGYRRQNSGGEAVAAPPLLAHPRPPVTLTFIVQDIGFCSENVTDVEV